MVQLTVKSVKKPVKPQGLVNVPFWEYWTSPKKVATKKTIYRSWLGDVQWGHLMTHEPVGSHISAEIPFKSPTAREDLERERESSAAQSGTRSADLMYGEYRGSSDLLDKRDIYIYIYMYIYIDIVYIYIFIPSGYDKHSHGIDGP